MRRGDYIFIVIVFVAFYVLNQFSVLIGDDFWYCFYRVNANGNGQFVNSFSDAICSQLHAYTTHNGRIIVHTLTSYFCGVLGMNVFKIFNSLIFTLMFYGLLKLSRKYIGYQAWDKYLIIFMLFVLMPYPGQIFLGSIAMCINYLWTSCAVIYLLIFYEYIKRHKYNRLGNVVVFIISILAGSLQESFTIGISGALFLYYCFHYKEFKGTIPYFVIGLWIGTAVVVFAPGNFLRLEGVDKAQSVPGFISSLSNFARLFTDTKLMIIVIVLSIILWSKNRVQIYNFYKENFVYIWSIIFNAFLVLITYSGERQLTCIELLSLILVLRLLLHFSTPIRIKKIELVYSILLSVVCLLLYYPIYNYRKSAFNTYTELANSPVINHTIVNRSYIDMLRFRKSNLLFSRYTYLIDFEDWVYEGFSLLKSNGKDRNYITAILPDSQESIIKQFDKYRNENEIYYNADYQYYVFREVINEPLYKVEISSEPLTYLGKIRAIMLGKKNSYTIDVSNDLRFFENAGYRYYLYYIMDYKVFNFVLNKNHG